MWIEWSRKMKYSRMFEKEISNFYKYYVKNIDEANKDRDSLIADYCGEYTVYKLAVCDFLSNDGVSKLIKKLHHLPKKKFSVTNIYREPSITQKYDYVHLKHYDFSGCGTLAKIEFIKDPYIKTIHIHWSQVNNYLAVIEYEFVFNKAMDRELRNKFVVDNIRSLSAKDYRLAYQFGHHSDESKLTGILQFQDEILPCLCQHYITTYLYSKQGSKYKLPSLRFCSREPVVDTKTVVFNPNNRKFYNKREGYIIEEDNERVEYALVAGGGQRPNFNISDLMASYGNVMYFGLLNEYVMHIFELEFSGYVSGRKRIKTAELNVILENIHGLKDEKRCNINLFNSEFKKNWVFCQAGDEKNQIGNLDKIITYTKKTFEDVYEHAKLKAELILSQVGRVISYFALGTAVLGVFLTILLYLLDQGCC